MFFNSAEFETALCAVTPVNYKTDQLIFATIEEYVDLEILPEEIDSIILGCRTSEEDKEEILELLKKKDHKHTKVLQVRKHDSRFALDFDEIGK